MGLLTSTLLTALILFICSFFLIRKSAWLYPRTENFLRSKRAAVLTFGVGSIWFLYYILNLGEADFGQYKFWLFLLFGGAAFGAFFRMEDFLSVRGVAVLILLSAKVILGTAYMQPPQSRLFLVSFIYLMIVLAIIVGGMPYLMREFTHWLFEDTRKPRVLGSILGSYGVVLILASFFY